MIVQSIKRLPILQLLVLLLAIFIFAFTFIAEPDQTKVPLSPFFSTVKLANQGWFISIIGFFNFSFLLLLIFELSSLLRTHHFANDSRIAQLFMLCILLFLFPGFFHNLSLVVSLYLLLRALRLLFLIHTQPFIFKELSWIALYLSVASLWFPPAFLFGLICYIGVLMQRGFYLKELLFYLIIFGLPYYFLYSAFFLIGVEVDYHYPFGENVFSRDFNLFRGYLGLAFLGLFIFLSFFSFGLIAKEVLRSRAQFRSFYILLLGAFSYSLFIDYQVGVGMALVPLMAIYAQSFQKIKRQWIVEAVLMIFLLASIVSYFLV